MEAIGASEIEARIAELLDRVAKGESFEITRQGRAVGRLVPPDRPRDAAAIAGAIERLKRFRGLFRGMGRGDLMALKHEGRRF
ncbi:MAG: type II toxin-antitoxin system prevent-host-death family antitoxin [Phycisphaerae bacterium]|nr:type II toxin-antitoxin system prevent-host-death family antitoxin [Phycisphaerae bacterium]